ncbi:hypothetical protein M436DRAFT_46233 [Aureobasidium namibiae CBS 147.97]|uniref:BZIP domain-containing protein n=1 Tax=Aureobasidium namibiae CBS 147.97 TaxID=1043004 RepID=A0A074WPF4_9PEZI
MSDPTPQQKANLARIRDNQRRSRARRKEYLQELEAKYRSCEAVGAEASQEIQAAARKVLDENKRLRRLLRQQGFSDADIDGPEHDEYASSPSAAEILNVMLVTPKMCRPSSTSACGGSRACKTEDDDDHDDGGMDMDSRRQSTVSNAATPASLAARQQKQLRPIALAPAPAPAPALAPAVNPRAHEHQAPPKQLTKQQQQQQQQHNQPQSAQQQFYMSAPPSHTSAPLAPQHNLHASPGTFVQDYPIYAPQPFGHSVPQSQLLDWDMAAAEAMPQSGGYPPQGQYASPTSNFQQSYASPINSNAAAYNGQDNTSSCFAAAGAIRALHEDAGDEVESALGCRAGGNECRVDNTMVFDLMDHYAGVRAQQGGM